MKGASTGQTGVRDTAGPDRGMRVSLWSWFLAAALGWTMLAAVSTIWLMQAQRTYNALVEVNMQALVHVGKLQGAAANLRRNEKDFLINMGEPDRARDSIEDWSTALQAGQEALRGLGAPAQEAETRRISASLLDHLDVYAWGFDKVASQGLSGFLVSPQQGNIAMRPYKGAVVAIEQGVGELEAIVTRRHATMLVSQARLTAFIGAALVLGFCATVLLLLMVYRQERRLLRRQDELGVALDELDRSRAHLVQSEKMASLGALVAGVAHEVNTPIGNARLAASSMSASATEFASKAQVGALRKSDLQEFLAHQEEGARIVESNLDRAAELVISFKQVAVDQSSHQRRTFELRQLVDETVMTMLHLIKRHGAKVEVQVPPGMVFDSYPGAFSQVFINLIGNAMVHGLDEESGGMVTIDAAPNTLGHIVVHVKDSGKGIPAEFLGKVFDPFFTTRLGKGGSGLGLSIVYNLVHHTLGGTIVVNSPPGMGAVFTLTIPLVAPTVSPTSGEQFE